MRYLILLLLIVGCSSSERPTYTETSVDPKTVPECAPGVEKATNKFISMEADNGDVLYIAVKGGAMCLKRHKQ